MAAESPTQYPAGAPSSLPSSIPTAQRNVGARRSDDDDTMDLARFVRAFERHWKLAVVGALIGGAIAFGLASLRAVRYEGVTTLLVVPPVNGSVASAIQMNPATFRSIVENASLAKQVIEELKLRDITPQQFVERSLDVEEVKGTSIVKVKVQLPDAAMAAEASHRTALKAILLTESVNQQAGASIQDQLKNHLNDARQRLQSAEKSLLDYKQSAQVEVVKADTDAQLNERGDLLRLLVDIESERARLSAAEQEIKRQPPLLTTPRVPSAEEALRRQEQTPYDVGGTRGQVDPQHLDLSNPFVNPVYQTLDFQIATTRTRVAALEKQRDELLRVKKIGGKDLEELNELYRRQIALARLQASFDLATRVYSDLELRYEQSRSQPVGSTAQLQIIDDALPPDRPLPRKRLQYAAFGALVGLLAVVAGALMRENAHGAQA